MIYKMNTTGEPILDRIEPGDWITISLLLVGAAGLIIAGIGVCMRRHPRACARCLSWCRRSRVSPTDIERAADALHDLGGRLSPVAIRLRVPPPPIRQMAGPRDPLGTLVLPAEPVYVEPADTIEALPVLSPMPPAIVLPFQRGESPPRFEPKLPIARLARSSQQFLDRVLELDAYPGELTGRYQKEQRRSFRRVASLRMPMRVS